MVKLEDTLHQYLILQKYYTTTQSSYVAAENLIKKLKAVLKDNPLMDFSNPDQLEGSARELVTILRSIGFWIRKIQYVFDTHLQEFVIRIDIYHNWGCRSTISDLN